jgi:hypothetical protein
MLTIIMHYSRVSTPTSRVYSAATAVLLNELLKGSISLAIAFCRIDSPAQSSHVFDSPQASWAPRTLLFRLRRLAKEVFSPDCWKLSIPAILYGKFYGASCLFDVNERILVIQSSKITCNSSQYQIWTQRRFRLATK